MGARWVILIAVVVIGLLAAAAYVWLSPAIAQDACLDGGGAWHNGACKGGRFEM